MPVTIIAMFEEKTEAAGYGTFGWHLDEERLQQQEQQQQQQEAQQLPERMQRDQTHNTVALNTVNGQSSTITGEWADILCAGRSCLPTTFQLTVVAMCVVVVAGRTFGTILDARLAVRFQNYTWFFSSFATPILFTAVMWPIVLVRHAFGFTDSMYWFPRLLNLEPSLTLQSNSLIPSTNTRQTPVHKCTKRIGRFPPQATS